MKNIFAKTLILLCMMGMFLVPVAPSVQVQDDRVVARVEVQEAEAQIWSPLFGVPWLNKKADAFGCIGWTTIPNCLVKILYEILFVPISWITAGVARLLDFFIFYSISNDAFQGEFMSKAWGAVRDIANIFFIVALLYVAIKTVLGLNVSNNKRIISYIIIVALLINFSLFITEVVVDASNVLGRVFYHQITPTDFNGNTVQKGGEKSITVALVDIFDPQEIFDESGLKAEDDLGKFTVTTLLAIVLCVMMIYIFLSVALLFIARVIGLWIAMIFSPLAFASYTVPFKIPGFGHQEWWDGLLKNAFLAPIFLFFLYVIALFGGFLRSAPGYGGETTFGLEKFMGIFIPFFIIFILLMQAKKLAQTYAGEIGKALNKAAMLTAGIAGGAALGATAIAGRAVIGRAGSALANSEKLKKAEAAGGLSGTFAKGARNLGKYSAEGTYDLRKAKIAGKNISSLGIDFGKGKDTSYAKRRDEQEKKRVARAKELELSKGSKEEREVGRTQIALNEIQSNQVEVSNKASAEKDLKLAETALAQAITQHGAGSTQAQMAQLQRDTAQQTLNANPIVQAQKAFNQAKSAVDKENRERRSNYANTIENKFNNTVNVILSGGKNSYKANQAAATKIRQGKQPKKKLTREDLEIDLDN